MGIWIKILFRLDRDRLKLCFLFRKDRTLPILLSRPGRGIVNSVTISETTIIVTSIVLLKLGALFSNSIANKLKIKTVKLVMPIQSSTSLIC